MTLRKQIKQNGKRCLYNNWGKAVAIVLLGTAIMLLFMIVEGFASMLLGISIQVDESQTVVGLIAGIPDTTLISALLTAVMAVGSFLTMTPLNLGILSWYRKLSDGESEDILSVFSCFANQKLYLRSLGLSILVGIRVLFLSFLYLVIPATGLVISYRVFQTGFFQRAEFVGSLGMVLSAVLLIVLGIFLLIHVQKYFLCRYYLLDGETTVRQAIKQSVHSTAGLRDEIFLYQLSFAGWWALCVFALPVLYVTPYYRMSSLLYARYLMERDERANRLAVYEGGPVEGEAINNKQTDSVTESYPGQERTEPEREADLSPTRQFDAQKTDEPGQAD